MIAHNEYEIQGLKGPVKQLKEQHFNVFEHDGLTYIGKPLEEYDSFNNCLILFNEQHKVLESINCYIGSFSKKVFDSDGYVIEFISYKSENLEEIQNRIVHSYSLDKLSEEEFTYDDNNKLICRCIKNYDTQKRIVELISFNLNNEIVNRNTWEYIDKFTNYTKFTEYNTDGSLKHKREQKLNQQGHTYEIIEFDEKGAITKTSDYRYLYNEDGTLKTDKQDNELTKRHIVVVEEDKYGNWIKKLIHNKHKPVYVYLRSFTYFNEEEKPNDNIPNENQINNPLSLQHPKTIVAKYWDARLSIDKIRLLNGESDLDLDNYQLQMVVDKSPSADKFSYFAYYAATNNLFPSQIEFNQQDIEVFALLDLLEKNFEVCIVHTDRNYDGGTWKQESNSYTITFYDYPAYLLHASDIRLSDEDDYDYISDFTEYDDYEPGYLSLGKVTLLHPPEGSGKRNKDFEEMLFQHIEECQVEDKPEQPNIHIVEVSNNNFQIIRYPVKNDFEIRDLDINYGYGFGQFHNELMMRFRGETKGLVLFHGLPGTGKTYYIRHLLREMANANKVVIYMPPNMVDYLTEPSFLTFLSRTVKNYNNSNRFCVLLIEDAEPLLAQRQSESRIQGVTNLLNMTDGLLNDMLKLQIICTFNVELSKLDAALLRPGRLIARKEFKPLSILDANRLAQRLGIKKEIKKPTTLSQIYAMIEGKSTIIHNPNEHE